MVHITISINFGNSDDVRMNINTFILYRLSVVNELSKYYGMIGYYNGADMRKSKLTTIPLHYVSCTPLLFYMLSYSLALSMNLSCAS